MVFECPCSMNVVSCNIMVGWVMGMGGGGVAFFQTYVPVWDVRLDVRLDVRFYLDKYVFTNGLPYGRPRKPERDNCRPANPNNPKILS